MNKGVLLPGVMAPHAALVQVSDPGFCSYTPRRDMLHNDVE